LSSLFLKVFVVVGDAISSGKLFHDFTTLIAKEFFHNSDFALCGKSLYCSPVPPASPTTTNTFKNRLDKYWSSQSLMYEDHKTTITGSGDLKMDDESNEEEI
jgi:hypothetical protein